MKNLRLTQMLRGSSQLGKKVVAAVATLEAPSVRKDMSKEDPL